MRGDNEGIMAFFTSSNPLTLFFALIVVLSLIKLGLGRIDYLKKNATYIVPLMLIAGVLCIVFYPILKLAALALPMIGLVFMFVFMIAALFFVIGMRGERVLGFLMESGFLKTVVYVLIVVAVVFAGSQIWGKQLLEDRSVSLVDAVTPQAEQREIDFSPIFTKQVAGFAMLMIVIGLAFWWVQGG